MGLSSSLSAYESKTNLFLEAFIDHFRGLRDGEIKELWWYDGGSFDELFWKWKEDGLIEVCGKIGRWTDANQAHVIVTETGRALIELQQL